MVMINAEINELKKNPSLYSFSFHRKIELQCKKNHNNCGFDGLFFLAEGIWKVHIFRHLSVCFQTSVYTLGEFPKNGNNNTVFEELEVWIVDLTVAFWNFVWFWKIEQYTRDIRFSK
jgi:hypothetical protein